MIRLIQTIVFYCLLFFLISCNGSKQVTHRSSMGKSKSHQTVVKAKGSSTTLVKFNEHASLTEVMTRARSEQKHIFIDFYTDYCPPCRLMDEEVFSDPSFAKYLNKSFVNLKVDAASAEGANLASFYGVRAYPTLLFVSANGTELIRKEGGTSISTLKDMALYAEQKQLAGK